MWRSLMTWSLTTEMEIGVFCRLVSRLVAVTTMSWSWPVSPGVASAAAGWSALACAPDSAASVFAAAGAATIASNALPSINWSLSP